MQFKPGMRLGSDEFRSQDHPFDGGSWDVEAGTFDIRAGKFGANAETFGANAGTTIQGMWLSRRSPRKRPCGLAKIVVCW
jgi:hypothetical protein